MPQPCLQNIPGKMVCVFSFQLSPFWQHLQEQRRRKETTVNASIFTDGYYPAGSMA
jgi:hypothetical protein